MDRTRYQETRSQMRRFRKVVTALGADPEAAMKRASDMLDELPDSDNMSDGDVFLRVLAELVEEKEGR